MPTVLIALAIRASGKTPSEKARVAVRDRNNYKYQPAHTAQLKKISKINKLPAAKVREQRLARREQMLFQKN